MTHGAEVVDKSWADERVKIVKPRGPRGRKTKLIAPALDPECEFTAHVRSIANTPKGVRISLLVTHDQLMAIYPLGTAVDKLVRVKVIKPRREDTII